MSKKDKQQHQKKPSSEEPKSDTSTWPLLLKNISTLITRTNHFTPIPSGNSPTERPMSEHLKYGEIN